MSAIHDQWEIFGLADCKFDQDKEAGIMEVDNDKNHREKRDHIEWVFVIFGSGSVLFTITYWILRVSSYSYTDVIYLAADDAYGKYFGAAFDMVCGILPALLIGLPMLIRAFWFSIQKNNRSPISIQEGAQSDEMDSETNP